jgi:imidazolonepropionase
MKTVIKNIGRIYSPDSKAAYGTITELENAEILLENGRISDLRPEGSGKVHTDEVIDAGGGTVLPGFVDAHTHPVFWNTRESEFVMRLQGKSYEEIAEAGGGIRNSARNFRSADKAAIKAVTRQRIARFFEYGTTTIEAKSGYGLATSDELKALEIIAELNNEQPLEMIPTFLGAHEVPDEYRDRREAYVQLVINEMLPLVAEQKLAQYCDVFCEKGVFSLDETRRIIQAAYTLGLEARIHADELHAFGGAELAAELNAASADHLVKISDVGIRAMAERKVFPVLLPVTTFFLRKDEYAPARKMIEAGCEVVVATDFNPGSSMTQNMQLAWSVAALKTGMLPGELLWATTLSAARSLGMDTRIGTVESGKQADLVIMDIPNLDYLPYHIGINHVKMTIKNGQVVYRKGNV